MRALVISIMAALAWIALGAGMGLAYVSAITVIGVFS